MSFPSCSYKMECSLSCPKVHRVFSFQACSPQTLFRSNCAEIARISAYREKVYHMLHFREKATGVLLNVKEEVKHHMVFLGQHRDVVSEGKQGWQRVLAASGSHGTCFKAKGVSRPEMSRLRRGVRCRFSTRWLKTAAKQTRSRLDAGQLCSGISLLDYRRWADNWRSSSGFLASRPRWSCGEATRR